MGDSTHVCAFESCVVARPGAHDRRVPGVTASIDLGVQAQGWFPMPPALERMRSLETCRAMHSDPGGLAVVRGGGTIITGSGCEEESVGLPWAAFTVQRWQAHSGCQWRHRRYVSRRGQSGLRNVHRLPGSIALRPGAGEGLSMIMPIHCMKKDEQVRPGSASKQGGRNDVSTAPPLVADPGRAGMGSGSHEQWCVT